MARCDCVWLGWAGGVYLGCLGFGLGLVIWVEWAGLCGAELARENWAGRLGWVSGACVKKANSLEAGRVA